MPRPVAPDVRGSARFSRDRRYRLSLTRMWGEGPRVLWVLLNPSAADAFEDDPTVARCTDFARRWGFGALEAVNLFALVTPSPAVLRADPRPVGPANRPANGAANGAANDAAIDAAIARADLVVAAWGAGHGGLLDRAEVVRARLPEGTRCLGVTRSGDPRHPLYLRHDTALVPLPPVARR